MSIWNLFLKGQEIKSTDTKSCVVIFILDFYICQFFIIKVFLIFSCNKEHTTQAQPCLPDK